MVLCDLYPKRFDLTKGLLFGTAQTTEPPGQKPLVVNGVVVGPFEEEEEGTGVTSDVVKVKGEDPATPGPLP